jgi:protein SCO1/2
MITIRGIGHLARASTVLLLLTVACSRPAPSDREYQLTGQILSIKPETEEVLVKHDDIKGFMPAMTMPYKVENGALLTGKQPGDLISATLVVGETSAYLKNITTTGHAAIELPPTQPEVSALDIVKPGEAVPDAPLVDEEGKPRPIASYRRKRLILTFIYTRCPDAEFCPLMNQQFAVLQRQIASTPALADVQLLSISFDPEHDTPDVLKAYAKQQQADPNIWHFATAPEDEVKKFAARFGLTVTSDGSPILIHNLATAVIDAEGRLVALHSSNQWKPADLVAELPTAAPSTN